MKHGKFFIIVVSVSAILFYLIINVAFTDMLGKEKGLAVANIAISLMGVIGGSFTALIIARMQIKKQESMKIIDLKIQKFGEISSSLQKIISCLAKLRNELIKLHAKCKAEEDKRKLNALYSEIRKETSEEIEKELNKVLENKVYFRLIRREPNDMVGFLLYKANGSPFSDALDIFEKEIFDTTIYAFRQSIIDLNFLKKELDDEIEKILLRNVK